MLMTLKRKAQGVQLVCGLVDGRAVEAHMGDKNLGVTVRLHRPDGRVVPWRIPAAALRFLPGIVEGRGAVSVEVPGIGFVTRIVDDVAGDNVLRVFGGEHDGLRVIVRPGA